MNHKLLLAALLTAVITAMSANQEQPPAHQDTTRDTTLILGWFTEQQWHDLMKNSVGPCHGPTNVKKCCQWKKDSIVVKRI